jgi:hypothetical protein
MWIIDETTYRMSSRKVGYCVKGKWNNKRKGSQNKLIKWGFIKKSILFIRVARKNAIGFKSKKWKT